MEPGKKRRIFLVTSLGLPLIIFVSLLTVNIATSSAWKAEKIDWTVVGWEDTQLLADESDGLHLLYVGNAFSYFALTYAKCTDGVWNVTDLFRVTHSLQDFEMALDPNGSAHIFSCFDYVSNLTCVTNKDGNWSVEEIGWNTYRNHDSIAAAVDSNGTIHLIDDAQFTPFYNRSLLHVWNAGSGWQTELIADFPADTSLWLDACEVDSSGNLHFLVRTWGSQFELIHGYQQNGHWVLENITQLGWSRKASMTIDSSDRVHVGYCQFTGNDSYCLMYGVRENGVWSISQLWETSNRYPEGVGIDLDKTGNVHLAYATNDRGFNHSLWHAYQIGDSWQKEIVTDDCGGLAFGPGPSFALDEQGAPHLGLINFDTGSVLHYTNKFTAADRWVPASKAYFATMVFAVPEGVLIGLVSLANNRRAKRIGLEEARFEAFGIRK